MQPVVIVEIKKKRSSPPKKSSELQYLYSTNYKAEAEAL